MDREERDKLYARALDKWGEDSQLNQMVEEMAELTVAISKYKRMLNNVAQERKGVIENLYEELADVKMCLEEMEYIYGKKNVVETMDKKLEKFLGQLNK